MSKTSDGSSGKEDLKRMVDESIKDLQGDYDKFVNETKTELQNYKKKTVDRIKEKQ